MDKELAKRCALPIIGLTLFPIVVAFSSILDSYALWLYAWAIPFCFILLWKAKDLFYRGLILIAYSISLCAIGTEVVAKENPEIADAIKNVCLMITLIAGGLGGNMMSHEIIQRHKAQ